MPEYRHFIRMLLCLPLLAVAEPDNFQKQQFRFKAAINVDAGKALQQLTLPESVQRELLYADGRDIHVTNAAGELQPVLVRVDNNRQLHSTKSALAFYPVSEPAAYIIEIPASAGYLQQLEFTWSPGFEGVADLQLETSGNLAQWQSLIVHESLLDMNYSGQQLRKNTLSMPQQVQSYLRLSWTSGPYPQLTAVNGRFTQVAQPLPYHWSEKLPLKKVSANTFDFSLSPGFHADRLRLVSASQNQVYIGFIESRNDHHNNNHNNNHNNHQQAWTRVDDFRFYQLQAPPLQTRHNHAANPMSVMETSLALAAGNNKQQWRIHFDFPAHVDEHDLAIQVNRYPMHVYFIAHGDGPWTLGYASASVGQVPAAVSQVVADLLAQSQPDAVGQASLQTAEAVPAWSAPATTDWKKILLWLSLLAGVAMLSGMARSLYRQLPGRAG